MKEENKLNGSQKFSLLLVIIYCIAKYFGIKL